jgi:hypothetical protein
MANVYALSALKRAGATFISMLILDSLSNM